MTTCAASRHDTLNAYKNFGCRCPTARLIWSRYCKAYHLRKQEGKSLLVDATGTSRRIRALMALGWRQVDIASRLPNRPDPTSVSQIAKNGKYVTARTAKAFADVYLELSGQQGPSEKLRKMAPARGWLEPGWWDDDTIDDPNYVPVTTERERPLRSELDTVVVERAMHGRPVTLTRAERLEAIRLMEQKKVNHKEIARRLRVDARQVLRDLSEMAAA